MKTTKAILLIGLLVLMPACTATEGEQHYAGVTSLRVGGSQDSGLVVLQYVDGNGQIRPFYVPQQ